MKRFLLAMAPLVAVCATFAVSAGTASASENVLAAIRHENLTIGASGTIGHLRHVEATDKHDPTKLAVAFDKLAGQCARAATYVSHSSADSSRQAAGRHDWVGAFQALSGALYKLGHATRELRDHHTAYGDRLLLEAEKRLHTAQTLGNRSNKLLGVRAF